MTAAVCRSCSLIEVFMFAPFKGRGGVGASIVRRKRAGTLNPIVPRNPARRSRGKCCGETFGEAAHRPGKQKPVPILIQAFPAARCRPFHRQQQGPQHA